MDELKIKEIAEEEAQSALAVVQKEAPEIEPEGNISSEAEESPPEVAESQLEPTPSEPEAVEEPSLGETLSEGYQREGEEACYPCDVAAGLSVTQGICEEKGLNCSMLKHMIDHASEYHISDAVNELYNIRDGAEGEAKEQLSLVIDLVEGKEVKSSEAETENTA